MEVNGGDQSSSPKRSSFLWYGELRFILREVDAAFMCYDGKLQCWGSFAKLQATHNLKQHRKNGEKSLGKNIVQ